MKEYYMSTTPLSTSMLSGVFFSLALEIFDYILVVMTRDELLTELSEANLLIKPHIAAAFENIDRADFVPEEILDSAYENIALPIGFDQTISQPLTVAMMLNLLDPKYGENVLDVGAGSGWQTALLAYLVSMPLDEHKSSEQSGHVTALEIIPELAYDCEINVGKYGFITREVVDVRCQNAVNGCSSAAPYDKIIAAAELDKIPEAWRNELKIGGVLVAPVNESIIKLTKQSASQFDQEAYPGFVFVPFVK